MSRKVKIAVGMVTGLLAILVGTAVALTNISLTSATVPLYDFGAYGGTQPGTVQIQEFTMKPREVIPWHEHKAAAYVVLERGTLTETHFDATTGQCVSEQFVGPGAFVEQPGEKHTITNSGQGAAVINWATVYPKNDGVFPFSPQFQAGGIYLVAEPSGCQVAP